MFQCFPRCNGNFLKAQNRKAEVDYGDAEMSGMEPSSEIKLAVYNIIKKIRVYHVGVLVFGKEFHYGIKTGVLVCEPMNNELPLEPKIFRIMRHKIKFLRYITLPGFPLRTALSSLDEVMAVKTELERSAFSKAMFNVICRNCIDFAREFITAIAAPAPPKSLWPQEFRQPLFVALTIRPFVRPLLQLRANGALVAMNNRGLNKRKKPSAVKCQIAPDDKETAATTETEGTENRTRLYLTTILIR